MKKCKVCGSENGDADLFCQSCGAEIALRAQSAPRKPSVGVSAAQIGQGKASRVCPKCGQTNEGVLVLCTNCGGDLTLSRTGAKTAGRLLLMMGQETFECRSGDVLGREGTVAGWLFASIKTVSRKHATLTKKEGGWFITVSLDVHNMTQLDGKELPRGVAQPLSGEHVLKLSTQCEVRLKVVST